MKILVDMNLSPLWVQHLALAGFEAAHWSTVGDPRASDAIMLKWARNNSHIVLTHDLDFGTLLAFTRDSGPSVIQVRAQNVTPSHLAGIVINALQIHHAAIEAGALVTIDEARIRARILPLLERS